MEFEGSSPYPLRPIIVSDPEFGAVRMIQVMYLWTIYTMYYLYIRVELPTRQRCFQNAEIMSVSYVYWTVHHLDSWIKRGQLDVTCFINSLFNAQYVSDVNTSILRSLRLIFLVISWVVLLWYDVCWCYVVVWLGWCGIRLQASACIRIPHHNKASDIKLVSLFSTMSASFVQSSIRYGVQYVFLQLCAPHSSLCHPSPAVPFLRFYNQVLNCSSTSFSYLPFGFVLFFVVN